MGCGQSNRNINSNIKIIEDKNLLALAFAFSLKEIKGIDINKIHENANKKKPLSDENNYFMEEEIIYGDESNQLSPWATNIIQPEKTFEEIKTLPKISLKPAHIFGYRCLDSRANIHFVDDSTIVYPSGSFGIVQSIKTKTQKIFGGRENIKSSGEYHHTNDIVSLAIYKGEVSMVATGQIDSRPYILVWSPYDPSITYGKYYQDINSKLVMMITFDSQGRYLGSLGRDDNNSFYIFDLQTKEIIWKEITGPNILFDIKFSPVDSDEFCLVGVSSVIFCNSRHKEKTNNARSILKYKDYTFTCVEYSSDGKKIITATCNGFLIIWGNNILEELNKQIFEIKLSEFSILNLKVSEKKKDIYCTDSNGMIFVVDSNRLSVTMKIRVDSPVKGIDINSKEKLLLGMKDGKIVIKNIISERIREISISHSEGNAKAVEFIFPNYVKKENIYYN
jgi:WD40 repeat protein